MGFWTTTIHGCGAHHNADYELDANKMARRFVKELQAAGHIVERADFAHSERDAIDDRAPDAAPAEPAA